MNRTVIIVSIIAIVCFITLITSGVISALVLFLLTGTIPGTEYALSPNAMLLILAGLLVVILNRPITHAVASFHERQTTLRRARRRAQLPHRRYLRRATHS